jgi:hypothetical protein
MEEKIVILMPPGIGRTIARPIGQSILRKVIDSGMDLDGEVVEYRGKRALIHVVDDPSTIDRSLAQSMLLAVSEEINERLMREIMGDAIIPTHMTSTDKTLSSLAGLPYMHAGIPEPLINIKINHVISSTGTSKAIIQDLADHISRELSKKPPSSGAMYLVR